MRDSFLSVSVKSIQRTLVSQSFTACSLCENCRSEDSDIHESQLLTFFMWFLNKWSSCVPWFVLNFKSFTHNLKEHMGAKTEAVNGIFLL